MYVAMNVGSNTWGGGWPARHPLARRASACSKYETIVVADHLYIATYIYTPVLFYCCRTAHTIKTSVEVKQTTRDNWVVFTVLQIILGSN